MEGISLGLITQKERDFFIPVSPITAIFHSSLKIDKEILVAVIGSLDENFCSWIDYFHPPLVMQIPGYLHDAQKVLSDLNDKKWQNNLDYC